MLFRISWHGLGLLSAALLVYRKTIASLRGTAPAVLWPRTEFFFKKNNVAHVYVDITALIKSVAAQALCGMAAEMYRRLMALAKAYFCAYVYMFVHVHVCIFVHVYIGFVCEPVAAIGLMQ